MMIHHSLTLETDWHTQMMWSVYRMVDDGVDSDEVDVFSESEQAGTQSTFRNWPNSINRK